MTKSHAILGAPLLLALLGLAFCIWSALGNDVNFCVTTGCTLYHDFTIGGISLWWFGAVAFACLAICSLLGHAAIGRWLGAIFLLGDTCLLMLMGVTAPCISCLTAALIFAFCYFLFRRQHIAVSQRPGHADIPRRSLLIFVWGIFFVFNVGQVIRSQFDVWPMLDESGQPQVRVFFSPTCPYCIEAVKALSGNVDVAWYPLSDHSGDVAQVSRMMALLEQGANMNEALSQSQRGDATGFWQNLRPDMILLRFHMLCNKAHVFMQGSQGVPFLEYKGLPPGIANEAANSIKENAPAEEELPAKTDEPQSTGPKDATLPSELIYGGQCGSGVPCPPGAETPRP